MSDEGNAAGGDGGANGAHRTVYAATPEAVRAVLQQLERNDPDCTSVVLTLAPPYLPIIDRIAAAVKDNTVLTSLKLELDPNGDIDEVVGDSGPIEHALKANGYLTVFEATGVSVPKQWHMFCRRNSCLEIPAPPPLQQSNPDREVVDLTKVPWALPEDDRFDALPLRDMISSGGMGVVYRVKVDGEVVAAKAPFTLINPEMFQLPDHAEARQTVLKDCMRELHALRRLNGHPNIVRFRCVFYTALQGVLFPKWICMDYLEKNLSSRISAGEVEFLPDVIGIVTGLEFIHNQGMMHRDIKPQNILVGPDGTTQVADLGFVRMCHALSGSVGPLTNVGTGIYLAPDIVEGTDYDPGRDVYAFGVTAVQMILREEPADKHEARMVQVKRAMDAAPDFAYLFRRCCERFSANRPSCRGLHVALEAQAAAVQADAAAADAERRLAQSEAARADAAQEAEAQRAQMERAMVEAETHQRDAQEARKTVAELTLQLAEAERRVAEAAAAPRGAPAASPPPTPDTPGQDALEAAMRILNHGVGPSPPCEEAVRLLRSAAAQGNPDALCELGVCLWWGRGVHVNKTEATELLREAVAKGSVEAAGYLARFDPDYRRTTPPVLIDAAVTRWRERAEQGHADAQFSLGKCYETGIGVLKDVTKAVRLYQLSADQGDSRGQNNLGYCYKNELGVPKDVTKAARLYQLSADQGNSLGQTNLGFCYENGLGVPKDVTKAARLYRSAADQGYSVAQSNLGWFHASGVGVPKDLVKALRLYRLSAEQGCENGQRKLGRCYMNGIGVEKDLVEARRLLTLSANQGDSQARDLLAELGPS